MNDIVFFDGECNLCDGFVQFIIDRDKAERFSFVSLQSEKACELLLRHGQLPTATISTVYLLRDGRLHERSEAVLLILRQLDSRWRYTAAALVLPRPLRDWAYRLVARYRYRLLGKSTSCRLSTPALRARFL